MRKPARRLLEESRQVSSREEKTRDPMSTKSSQQAEVPGLGSLGFWKEGPEVALQLQRMGRGRPSSKAGPRGKGAGAGRRRSTVWDTWTSSGLKTVFAILTTFGLSD